MRRFYAGPSAAAGRSRCHMMMSNTGKSYPERAKYSKQWLLKSVVPTSKQLAAAHQRPQLEVSILRAAHLLLHLVLDNVQRFFALVDHVKGLIVFK